MKAKIRKSIKLALDMTLGTSALALLCLSLPAHAGNKAAPGQSSAFGKTLAQWQDLYWRWTYGNVSVPTDSNGNAVANGVVLCPLPAAFGDGTPAHLDVTLNNGQPFFLPLWNLLGNNYSDGTPPDPLVSFDVFQTLDLKFQIDGVTVLDKNNMLQYYSSFSFDPAFPLPADFAPYAGFIWLEGISLAHAPFTPGTHTMKLDAKNTIPAFGFTFEYHNTWTVTVLP